MNSGLYALQASPFARHFVDRMLVHADGPMRDGNGHFKLDQSFIKEEVAATIKALNFKSKAARLVS